MSIEKRYQVFISSTFKDLMEERQAVLKAVLELDHMPAGMELFPAADESAWQLIKDVIDRSDYYVLIVGGRYGSLDAAGIGYTEKEYDYALTTKKPVIALLHQAPEKIPREKTETDSAAWERLKKFRSKVEKTHTCNYWTSAEDLKSKVIVALTSATKRNPQVGWVRADQVPQNATLADVLALRQRVAELEAQLQRVRTEAPAGTENLASGEDTVEMEVGFRVRPAGAAAYVRGEAYHGRIHPSWDGVFAAIAPAMINEASEAELKQALDAFAWGPTRSAFGDAKRIKGMEIADVSVSRADLETVIVQLRALGLIRQSERKRSIKDTGSYWTLTPYGDQLMVKLRAITREEAAEGTSEASPREQDEETRAE